MLNTANYKDFVILNGGIRYDDYIVRFDQQSASPTSVTIEDLDSNCNLGLTVKPLPNGSVYVAYATSSNPVGAEFDGTTATYGGLPPVLNAAPNGIWTERNKAVEDGTKWELFDRRLLVTGALFQTKKDNAATNVGTFNGVGNVRVIGWRGLSRPRHRLRCDRKDHR